MAKVISSLPGSTGILSRTSQLTNDGESGVSTYVELDDISTVATTGDYNNLINIPINFTPKVHTHNISDISGTKSEFNTSLTDGDFLFVGDVISYTNEEAQDAVGSILTDSTTIDFTYDDTTPTISANVKLNSIDATHLADGINITEFTNNANYETTSQLNIRDTNNRNRVNHTGEQPISTVTGLQTNLDLKQDNLVSGTTIKTIEGQSILGSGNIDITKSDVGLPLADNTSDASKSVLSSTKLTTPRSINGVNFDGTSNITINAVDSTPRIAVSEKGAINGVATLGSDGKVPNSQIPALAISETFPVSSQAQMLALSQADQGDVAIRSDISKSFILRVSPSSVLANWSELLTPTGAVTSVNGQVGVVTLSKSDVGLSNVDNTSDANKPVSNATQTALDLKANDLDVVKLTGNQTISGQKTFNNSSTGSGIVSSNSSTGFGIVSINSSTGSGIVSINSSTGDGIVSRQTGTATGFNYVGQNNSTNTFTVDKTGNVIGNSYIKRSTPATNILLAGGTDITQASLPVSTATQTALNNKENAFTKNTAFNKNFGTTAGTVVEGGTLGSNAYTSTAYLPINDGYRTNFDFNSKLASGFYNSDATNVNSPGGQGYSQLIVAKGVDTGLQISGGHNIDNLHFRGWSSNGSNFTPWRKVWHDGNDGVFPKLANVNLFTNKMRISGGGVSTSISDVNTTATHIVDVANTAISLATGYVGSDNVFLQAFNNSLNTPKPLILNPFGGDVVLGGGLSALNYTGDATLTGTPTAPTPTAGSVGTQIATKEYVLANAGGVTSTGTTNRIPKFTSSNSLGDSGLIQVGGNIGMGSAVVPGELFHIGDGNILLEGGGEVAQKFKRDFTTTGENLGVPTGSGISVNPIFQVGRIIQAGDGDPEIRIMYSDDNTSERTVFEVDRKGIAASVKTSIGSHFEGFASLTDVNPKFRLNSYPRMRLEMGAGGNDITDVAVERGATGSLDFFTNSAYRGGFDSSGNLNLLNKPTAPTATAGTNTTQIATTAFVQANYLPLTGGTLSGAISGTSANFSSSVTASGFFQSSDKNLKDIIKRDGDVAYFTWKDGRDDKTHIGYIAQEVRRTNPDQVQKGEDKMLSVNYVEILVEKVQSLEKRVKQLEYGLE